MPFTRFGSCGTLLTLLIGLTSCGESDCIKDKIIRGAKYRFVDSTFNEANSYFVFSDTGQAEYQNDQLFSASRIYWHDCDSYSLVVSEINDIGGLAVNDTVHLVLQSFNNDTFTYIVEAKGYTMTSRFFRGKE